MPRLVVTGTDTDIGKSVFASGLSQLLHAHYWKPIQAGLEGESDSEFVRRLGVPAEHVIEETYRLTTPCSPHQAARIDGITLDPARLVPPAKCERLVIEGAGGVLVPVTPEVLFADLFALWQLPVILVASTRLGTINHSLLSLEALRHRKVPVHGIAFVGEANLATETTICRIGNVHMLGRLPIIDKLDAASLSEAFTANFKLENFV